MAKITLGSLKDLWQNVSDWVKGIDNVSAPKVTVDSSALPTGAATESRQVEQLAQLEALNAKQEAIIGHVDNLEAATGAPTDAEATDNGSVIGILKRIRTLLGDAFVTLGSAIGTKARLIAGSDGTNARAIKTTNDGTVLTQLSGSNVEVVTFDKSNPLSPRVIADYELRSTAVKNHYFTQMRRANDQEGGLRGEITNIFEQTIMISSTLDAKLNVVFGITDDTSGNSFGHLITSVNLWDMPEGNVTKRFTILAPEKGALTPDPEDGPRVFELPELRLPYPGFYLRLKALTTPTTGEIKIMVCRRY